MTGKIRKSLRTNISTLYVLHFANLLLPLITLPYLLRVLGSANYGRMAFAYAFIAYFNVLCDFGFNLAAPRRVAQIRDDSATLGTFAMTVFVIKFALALVGFAIMMAVVLLVPGFRANLPLYLLAFLAVFGTALFPVWLFQGLEQMGRITVLSITARVITLSGIFLFVRHEDDYLIAAGLQSSWGLISGTIAMFLLPSMIAFPVKFPTWADITETVKDSWHIFISNVAVNLYSSTNVFLLGLLANPVAVGHFAAAEKIVKAVTSLFAPVTQAMYPYIAQRATRETGDPFSVNRKLLFIQGGISLVLSIALVLGANLIVRILFGEEMMQSAVLMMIMAPLPFAIGVSNVLGIQTMLNFGLTKQFSRILIASGLLNIALILLTVPTLSAIGAALSVTTTEIVVTLTMAVVLYRSNILKPLIGIRAREE